jgi:hypothetical protein
LRKCRAPSNFLAQGYSGKQRLLRPERPVSDENLLPYATGKLLHRAMPLTFDNRQIQLVPEQRMRVRLSTRALALALSLSMVFPGAHAAQDPGWPREITRDDATLVYYQPQIDEWKDFKEISGRMAVSVTPRGGKPHVGIVALQMHTDVDVDSRNALLSQPEITGLTFPDTDPRSSSASARRSFYTSTAIQCPHL